MVSVAMAEPASWFLVLSTDILVTSWQGLLHGMPTMEGRRLVTMVLMATAERILPCMYKQALFPDLQDLWQSSTSINRVNSPLFKQSGSVTYLLESS